jgi:serine/threonine-protein kinase
MSLEEISPGLIGGRYRLDQYIDRGGMAEVWMAVDTFLDRKVAVKLLKPHLANDAMVAERFRREAIACAKLSHPNIVAVYDCIEYNGRQAVIMQYVQGKSLRSVLDKQKRFGAPLTVHIGTSVALALDEAHREGLIHRDVKPGNILLTPEGKVLLADFGIAKALTSDDEDLTSDNIMMGTAKYLSPEQVRGKPLDGRADLYGLGLVLYECLAGRVPFIGESDADTALARLQREPTDLGRLRPSLTPQLVEVIHTLLARNPDHRFATGRETAVALDASVVGNDVTRVMPVAAVVEPERVAQRDVLGDPHITKRAPARQPVSRAPRRARKETRRLFVLLAALGIVCAGVVWQLSAESNSALPTDVIEPTPVEAPTLSVVALTSYDPNGDDGEENDALIPYLLDGNPETTWQTTCYANQFFGSKEYVGLLLQLSRPATGTLRVGMKNAPWAIDVFGANDIAPASFDAWGAKIGGGYNTVRKGANFLIAEPSQFILIALREVGASPMCSASNQYQGILAGVTFVEG